MSAAEGTAGHGWHIPACAPPPARVITWHPVVARTDRARVLRWTCECRLTVYLLVTGGGRGWIRRSVRTSRSDRPAVRESEPLRYAQVADLWEKILLGQVR